MSSVDGLKIFEWSTSHSKWDKHDFMIIADTKENAVKSLIDKFGKMKDREKDSRLPVLDSFNSRVDFYENHPIEGCIRLPNDYGDFGINSIEKFLRENEPKIHKLTNGFLIDVRFDG